MEPIQRSSAPPGLSGPIPKGTGSVLKAIRDGSLARFQGLVTDQTVANQQRGKRGATALHFVVKMGGELQKQVTEKVNKELSRKIKINQQMMSHLLTTGANVCAQDKKQHTPSHWAIKHENGWALPLLHGSASQLITLVDGKRRTPLDYAVPSRFGADGKSMPKRCFNAIAREPAAFKLVRLGSNCNGLDFKGRSSFHRALENGQQALAALMVKHGALASPPKSDYGRILAERAVQRKNSKALQLLLDARLDPDVKVEVEGSQSLSLVAAAIRSGCAVETLQMLLDQGAAIDAQVEYEISILKKESKVPALIRATKKIRERGKSPRGSRASPRPSKITVSKPQRPEAQEQAMLEAALPPPIKQPKTTVSQHAKKRKKAAPVSDVDRPPTRSAPSRLAPPRPSYTPPKPPRKPPRKPIPSIQSPPQLITPAPAQVSVAKPLPIPPKKREKRKTAATPPPKQPTPVQAPSIKALLPVTTSPKSASKPPPVTTAASKPRSPPSKKRRGDTPERGSKPQRRPSVVAKEGAAPPRLSNEKRQRIAKQLVKLANKGDAEGILKRHWPPGVVNVTAESKPLLYQAVLWCKKPLRQGSTGSRVGVVEALLDRGARPNEPGQFGWTPLHLAAFHLTKDGPAVVRALLRKGADPNQADDNGSTPLQYAEKKNNTAVIELLKSNLGPDTPKGPPGLTKPKKKPPPGFDK